MTVISKILADEPVINLPQKEQTDMTVISKILADEPVINLPQTKVWVFLKILIKISHVLTVVNLPQKE